jgi:hypothetical protein
MVLASCIRLLGSYYYQRKKAAKRSAFVGVTYTEEVKGDVSMGGRTKCDLLRLRSIFPGEAPLQTNKVTLVCTGATVY